VWDVTYTCNPVFPELFCEELWLECVCVWGRGWIDGEETALVGGGAAASYCT
jgi:hypothetical protein